MLDKNDIEPDYYIDRPVTDSFSYNLSIAISDFHSKPDWEQQSSASSW